MKIYQFVTVFELAVVTNNVRNCDMACHKDDPGSIWTAGASSRLVGMRNLAFPSLVIKNQVRWLENISRYRYALLNMLPSLFFVVVPGPLS